MSDPWNQFKNIMPTNPVQNMQSWGNTPMISPDTKLNFEQRVLAPSQYPVINNPDGSWSTHRMMWNDANGKYRAYPSIVQMPEGNLVQLSPREAEQHALRTGEYREFKTAKEAEAYATGGYKQHWGQSEKGRNR